MAWCIRGTRRGDQGLGLRRILGYYRTWFYSLFASIALTSLLYYFEKDFVYSIPRTGIPYIATIFTTLLGLTFAAFTINMTVVPLMNKNSIFLIEDISRLFLVVMVAQLLSLSLSLLAYLFFDSVSRNDLLTILIFLIIISLLFFLNLILLVFRLFRSVIKKNYQ